MGTSIKRGRKRSKHREGRNRRQSQPVAEAKSPKSTETSGERSVAIGGNASRTIIATGDHNVINVLAEENPVSNAAIQELLQRNSDDVALANRKLDELREPVEVSELRGKVELLGSLYSRGNVELALEQGENLRKTVPTTAPPNLKHSLFAILSSAKLRLGRTDEAVTDSESSLRDEPENLTLLENAANTNLIAGNLPRAAELARLALARENSAAAMSVLVQTTFSEAGREAVLELARQNTWATDEQLVQTAVAVTYMQEENYDEAERWLRRNPPTHLNEPHEAAHVTFLAELLIEQTQKEFARTLPLPWAVASEHLERLEEAIELTSKVVEFWTNKEPVSKLGRALAERATARLLSSQSQLALDDLNTVATLGAEDDLSRLTRVRILLDLEQPNEVVDLIEKIPIDKRIKGYDGMLGGALYKLKRLDEASEVFERELSKAETPNERLASLEPLLDVYGKRKDTENAGRVSALVQAEGSHRATSFACLAAYHYGQGHHDEAHKLFRQALELPQGTSLVHFEYADILASEGRWSEAADLVGSMIDLDAQLEVMRRYAIWLFNAQRFQEALEFTTSARERHGVLGVITAIEAEIRYMASDYAATVPLLTELERLESNDTRHRFILLAAYIGLSDATSARSTLNRIDAAELRTQPHDLMWLAQITQALDMVGATELAWEAQRAAPSDHDLFTAYFRILTNDNHIEADVDGVGVNTTVTLTYPSGKTSTVTLLDRDDLGSDELNLRHNAAQKLIGKREGEEVLWSQTSTGPTFVKIEKVRHKYVARFQDTNPNDLPSDQPTLELFQATDGEVPNEVVERLIANAQIGNEIFEAYAKSRVWSLQTVAFLLQISLPTARLALRRRHSGKLRAFDGSQIYAWDNKGPLGLHERDLVSIDELRYRRVAKADRVVMDDSALLTLAELDMLSLLKRRFKQVFVPQTIVNAFDTEITQGTGLLLPSVLPTDLGIVDRARQWAREHATLVPAYTRLEKLTERFKKYSEILPHPIIDAVITAEELDVPLFTDDVGLCNLLASSWKVRSTNTQHLLNHALNHGYISLTEQARQLARLVELKYTFVSFSAFHLIALFSEKGLSPPFRHLVTGLSAPETSRSSAFIVAMGFFDHLVFGHPQPSRICDEAIDLVLDTLSHGEDPNDVAKVFREGFLREPGGQVLSLYIFHKRLERWLGNRR